MQTSTQLADSELEQVTGGFALAVSLLTEIKFDSAVVKQAAADVGLISILTVQSITQSAAIAQA